MSKTHKRLALALEWARADSELRQAKVKELELRNQVIAACYGELPEGTTSCELERGYVLKAVVRPSAKADEPKLKAALDALRKVGAVGELLATRLVRWKPEVSIAELKKLSAEHREILGDSVNVALSTPSLDLKAPT